MIYRSAITGKFVSKEYAETNPETTVSEGVLGSMTIEETGDMFHIELELDGMPIEQAIHTALGAASACWENIEAAGAFIPEFALDIGDQLLERVRREVALNGYSLPR